LTAALVRGFYFVAFQSSIKTKKLINLLQHLSFLVNTVRIYGCKMGTH
jgi:hypothetical protein